MEKSHLADPAFVLYEDLMHHRDLCRWTAEGMEADVSKCAHRLANGDAVLIA